MNSTGFRSILAALMLCAFAITATAEEYEAIAEFETWSVFKDEGACWIAANADEAGDFVAED